MELNDKDFMQSPYRWPLGNVCAIKCYSSRIGEMPHCGFLVTADGIKVEPVVFEIDRRVLDQRTHGRMDGNTFSIIAKKDNPRTGGDQLPAKELVRYKTFDELLAAGWIVD